MSIKRQFLKKTKYQCQNVKMKTNTALIPTLDLMRAFRKNHSLKTSRNFDDVFTSRIIQAGTKPNLIGFMEELSQSLNVASQYVGGNKIAEFLKCASSDDGHISLQWIRENPTIVSMICRLKDNKDGEESEWESIVNSLEISGDSITDDSVIGGLSYNISIKARLQSPLIHGSDKKAGNATLFRRRPVLGKKGTTLDLPIYAGNSLRGVIRDLLADHFLKTLGLNVSRMKPEINNWFFHSIYSGGALEAESKQTKAIISALGNHGTIKTEGIRDFRDRLPGLSLFGSAMGNKILEGRMDVGDLRPECKEWSTGDKSVYELFSWVFGTRHDKYEGRQEDDQHQGMIYNMETLKEGVVMHGGIDPSNHMQPLEISALGRGLELLIERGKLGANRAAGYGKCIIEVDGHESGDMYQKWLEENKEETLTYLREIGAIN